MRDKRWLYAGIASGLIVLVFVVPFLDRSLTFLDTIALAFGLTLLANVWPITDLVCDVLAGE